MSLEERNTSRRQIFYFAVVIVVLLNVIYVHIIENHVKEVIASQLNDSGNSNTDASSNPPSTISTATTSNNPIISKPVPLNTKIDKLYKFNNTYKDKFSIVPDDKRFKNIRFGGIDFFIVGWPKSGTTTLLASLGNHPELVMPKGESWWFWRPTETKRILEKFEGKLQERAIEKRTKKSLPKSLQLKRGLKCPGEYKLWAGTQLFLEAGFGGGKVPKLIIGIRHPVLLFQSFYNYRVTEWNTPKGWFYHAHGPIPKPDSLMGDKNWGDGVNANAFRFDQYLKRMMKTPNSMKAVESGEWKGWERAAPRARRLPNEVFIYHIDQLGDKNTDRSTQFRSDLQRFLNLTQPIDPFPVVNNNPQTFPQTINICDKKHDEIRAQLVQIGRESYDFIEKEFLHSEEVHVSNPSHFRSLIEEFRHDPCFNWTALHAT